MTTVFPDFLNDLLTQGTHSHSLPLFGVWRMAYDRHMPSRSRTRPHRFLEPQGLGAWVSPPQLPLMSALRIEFPSQSVAPLPSPSPLTVPNLRAGKSGKYTIDRNRNRNCNHQVRAATLLLIQICRSSGAR